MNPLDEPPLPRCERCRRQSVLWLSGDTRLMDRVGVDGPGTAVFRCPACGRHYRWGEGTWRQQTIVKSDDLAEVLKRVQDYDVS